MLFAYRFWLKQFRTSALRLILLSMVLALAAVLSVKILAQRVDLAFERDAAQLNGGDIVVVGDRLIPHLIINQAKKLGLKTALVNTFPTMARSGEATRLISLKAVESSYPLRGKLKISHARGQAGAFTQYLPADGEVWVDDALLSSMSLQVGDYLDLGEARFKITAVLLQEPDRPLAFANFAPRAMILLSDLPKTELIQDGSRINYKLLVAAENFQQNELNKFTSNLKQNLPVGLRMDDVKSARPEVQLTLKRANSFLSISALLSTLIACVGVGLSAIHFSRTKQPEIALLKSLGFSPSQLFYLYTVGLMGLILFSCMGGLLLAYVGQAILLEILSDWIGTELPSANGSIIGLGLVMSVALVFGFIAIPLIKVLRIQPIAVLRKQPFIQIKSTLIQSLAALFSMYIVIYAACEQAKLATMVMGSCLVIILFFSVFNYLLIRFGMACINCMLLLGWSWGLPLRHAWVSLSRRIGSAIVQGLALTLGLTALLLLLILRGDLIDAWQKNIPVEAPNRFALNIQPDQELAFQAFLKEQGVVSAQLFPIVRGRLVAINNQPIRLENFSTDRALQLLNREFNLSEVKELPGYNRLISGAWFQSHSNERISQANNLISQKTTEISIELSLANNLHLKIGDTLQFDIAGQTITGSITSFREVRWDSMQANFYVLFPINTFSKYPKSLMTAFYLPSEKTHFAANLLKKFANITLVDTTVVLSQARNTLNQVTRAIEFIFLFTLVSGALVLFVSLQMNQSARTHELALMRALGASSAQISRSVWLELVIVGTLAGLLSGLAAQIVGAGLAFTIFDMTYIVSPYLLLGALIMGILIVLTTGIFSVRRIIKSSPLVVLRTSTF